MASRRLTIPKLKKKAWRIFSKYVRERDAIRTTKTKTYAKCITCDKRLPIKKMHAGHWISRIYTGTLFEETNVHAQCVTCNTFREGEHEIYRRKIIKLYGEEEVDRLYQLSQKKFTKDEARRLYEDVIQKYKNLTR